MSRDGGTETTSVWDVILKEALDKLKGTYVREGE
jgi:hypothetical protein